MMREFSPDEQLQHSFHVAEPFLTLLSAPEQRRIAQRFDFDYRRTATNVAVGILVVGLVGAVASVKSEAWLSLAVAMALVIEEIVRIYRLGSGPVGSFLAPVVRLFARKFL